MPEKRICLRCNQPFDSAGPTNRLCVLCNRANAGESIRAAHVPHASKDKQIETLNTRIRKSEYNE